MNNFNNNNFAMNQTLMPKTRILKIKNKNLTKIRKH